MKFQKGNWELSYSFQGGISQALEVKLLLTKSMSLKLELACKKKKGSLNGEKRVYLNKSYPGK